MGLCGAKWIKTFDELKCGVNGNRRMIIERGWQKTKCPRRTCKPCIILRVASGMLKSRMFGRTQGIAPIISNFGVFHDTLLVFETITRFASRH